ncbi:hypothetical protein OAF30_04420, partial [Flavobacteriales bacterium]|nr:hypothetical protein [Flavobacteriales bacterium]
DISDRLIKALGYVPGETLESDTKEGDEGKSLKDKAKDAMEKGKGAATDRMRGAAGGMRGGNTVNSKGKN